MPITISDVHDLIRLLEEHPDWQEVLQRKLLTEKALLRLLEENPELRAELRRRILSDEFLQLPERVRRVEDRLTQLTELIQALVAAQQRTDAQIAELTAAQQRTDTRVAELVIAVQELIRRHERFESWREGEVGRREGERYEREIRRQAMSIFYGGFGGAPEDPQVMARVQEWIPKLASPDQPPTRERDPMLADLLRWKGARVIVAEVSFKVDRMDILRAKLRADALRQIGVDATPVVIGEDWATLEARDTAIEQGVAWFAGDEMSPEFIEIRKLTDGVA